MSATASWETYQGIVIPELALCRSQVDAADEWMVGVGLVDFANRARLEGSVRLDELLPHVFWASEINGFYWEMQRNGCDGVCANTLFPYLNDRSKLDVKLERLINAARALGNPDFLDLVERVHKHFLKRENLFRRSWKEMFFVNDETVKKLNDLFFQVCDERFVSNYKSWLLESDGIRIIPDELYDEHLLELLKLNPLRLERQS